MTFPPKREHGQRRRATVKILARWNVLHCACLSNAARMRSKHWNLRAGRYVDKIKTYTQILFRMHPHHAHIFKTNKTKLSTYDLRRINKLWEDVSIHPFLHPLIYSHSSSALTTKLRAPTYHRFSIQIRNTLCTKSTKSPWHARMVQKWKMIAAQIRYRHSQFGCAWKM